jgi:adenylosuccinate synthase
MPSDLEILEGCEPVYETLKGWHQPTTGVTSYKKLPAEAKRYLQRVEELSECPIDIVSTGSKRDETIVLRNPLKETRRTRSR